MCLPFSNIQELFNSKHFNGSRRFKSCEPGKHQLNHAYRALSKHMIMSKNYICINSRWLASAFVSRHVPRGNFIGNNLLLFVRSVSLFMAITPPPPPLVYKSLCCWTYSVRNQEKTWRCDSCQYPDVPYFKCTADCTIMYEAVYVVCMQK